MSWHTWNQYEHTDEENNQWCLLRAIEWSAFPVFLTQPFVPILLYFFNWIIILMVIVAFNWLWNVIKYKYINITLSTIAAYVVGFNKWIWSIGFAINFLIQKQYILSILSIFYPFLSGIIARLNIPVQVGIIQKFFMHKLGYTEFKEN
jgi:hypothetical protein